MIVDGEWRTPPAPPPLAHPTLPHCRAAKRHSAPLLRALLPLRAERAQAACLACACVKMNLEQLFLGVRWSAAGAEEAAGSVEAGRGSRHS